MKSVAVKYLHPVRTTIVNYGYVVTVNSTS